jgi:hypothetical protein
MLKINKVCVLLLLPLAMAGCTSITNLTPTQYSRSPAGYYRVEAAWSTRERTILPDSINPRVMIGFDTYPMHREALVQDRWETFVPIPAEKDSIYYRFKFDFRVEAIRSQHDDSLMSQEYSLHVK